ncbi:MAG: glutamate ligase domain-containing protein, partial [Candidatus Dormibacteria bacterium]
TSQIPLMGEHNLANARAALAILASLGPGPQDERERAARALHNFHGLVHRTQLVRRHQGVDYVDDLSSTTPQSTVAAVLALGRACTLIAGGEDKGIDFQHLAKLVGGPVRTLVLLPGAGSDRLEQAVREEGGGELIHRCKDLHGAVDLAASLARSGEAVLLSPACPGFFSAHYRQGGFRQAVRSATSPRPRTGPG